MGTISDFSVVMGRPETDPVLLMAVSILQIMMNLPDRTCAEACLYDARWRVALGEIPAFHPTTLVKSRNRLASHGKAKIALEFLAEFGGPEFWEPWHGRYAERNPENLRTVLLRLALETLRRLPAAGTMPVKESQTGTQDS